MKKIDFLKLTLERLEDKGYMDFHSFSFTNGDHILFRGETVRGIDIEFAFCKYSYAVKYRAVGQKYWETMGVIA
ncbi:hypothetical protein [Bacillus paralicheniformis]|uniref:hypothetical protein n=1 Tax=Bacillus paralicheniformis TaxID=1648923 RepID=UPI0011A604FD|nr:hypothetical protein [Bacillus paralicheniformis]